MNIKRYLYILLAICFFILSGCGSYTNEKSLPQSGGFENNRDTANASSEESKSEENTSGLKDNSDDFPSSSSEQNSESLNRNPSFENRNENLNFTEVGTEDMKILLKPILERAAYFCDYGRVGDIKGVEMDFSESATIRRPYRNDQSHIYYPYTNLPYQTVDELKQDMCTVFTPDVLEGQLSYIFSSLADDNGRLYFASGIDGYSKETFWNLETLEILKTEPTQATVSMSVWEPREDITFVASLNLKLENGYVLMDESYFA